MPFEKKETKKPKHFRGLNTATSSIHNTQAKKKTHIADVLLYLWEVNLASQKSNVFPTF